MPVRAKRRPLAQAIQPRYLRPGGNRRVRRRRRARVVMKISFWCLLWLAGAALAAAGFVQGWRLMEEPGRFPVRRIVVQGGEDSLNGDVRASLGAILNRNMLTMDLHAIERRAMAHPWVREASVWRQIPGTIHVLVTQRSVAALVEASGEIRMISADGTDLGPLTRRHAETDHTIIRGAESADRAETSARIRRGILAIRRLESETPSFAASLSSIDVSRTDRYEATLRDFWPPVYLNPEDPTRNVDRLATVRDRLASEGMTAAYVDLRFQDRVAVLPLGESEVSGGA